MQEGETARTAFPACIDAHPLHPSVPTFKGTDPRKSPSTCVLNNSIHSDHVRLSDPKLHCSLAPFKRVHALVPVGHDWEVFGLHVSCAL